MGMFEDIIGTGFLGGLGQSPNPPVSQWAGYPGTGQSQAMYGTSGAGGNRAAISGNPQSDVGFWDSFESYLDSGGGEAIDWWAQHVDRRNNTPMRAIDHAPVPGGSPLAGPGVFTLQQLIQQLGGY